MLCCHDKADLLYFRPKETLVMTHMKYSLSILFSLILTYGIYRPTKYVLLVSDNHLLLTDINIHEFRYIRKRFSTLTLYFKAEYTWISHRFQHPEVCFCTTVDFYNPFLHCTCTFHLELLIARSRIAN